MKTKVLSINLLIICSVAMAQQSPQPIQKQIAVLSAFSEKYDDNVAIDTVYRRVNRYIEKCSKQPESSQSIAEAAIWHSVIASFLNDYYDYNAYRYQIRDRTASEQVSLDSPKLWDRKTFIEQIIHHHLMALQHEKVLQKIPISEYKTLLDTLLQEELRPSLYDFLAHRFCDYLQKASPIMQLDNSFHIDNADYFAPNKEFATLPLTTSDSLSLDFYWAQTMQKLTAFHLQTQSLYPIIDLTIHRLKWAYDNVKLDNKDSIYEKALLQLEQEYRNQKGYEIICYQLGEYYRNQDDFLDDKDNSYVIAMEWYDKARHFAPGTLTAKNARHRMDVIRRISISINLNAAIPSEKYPIAFESTNCDSLYYLVIKIGEKEYVALKTIDFSKQKIVFEDIISVQSNHNYRKVGTLSELPKLPYGSYAVFVSHAPICGKTVRVNSKLTSGINALSSYFFRVSDLCLSTCRVVGGDEILVTNRRTGSPVSGARISFRHNGLNRQLITDKDGKVFYEYDSDNATYYGDITVVYGADKLEAKYFRGYQTEQEPVTSVKLFFDRAIYRPAQTVYYKGIIFLRDSMDYSRTLAGKALRIVVKDANNQEFMCDTLTSGAYGSFAGSFVLPPTGLTGKFIMSVFSIAQKRIVAQSFFQVEEYKRPQFEIVINQPEATYKLGQEITISGLVSAYAGYPLPDVEYTYQVKRSDYVMYHGYYSETINQEIVYGTARTDPNGAFSINFPALENQRLRMCYPLYQYHISITVTDANGETHTETTTVMVSQKSLQFQCDLPSVVLRNEPMNPFSLQVLNLSDHPQTAEVNYRLESLQMPATFKMPISDVFDNKLNFSINEQDKSRFPQYAFGDENNPESWPIDSQKAQGTWEVTEDFTFSVQEWENLKDGYYKLTVSTTDVYGEIIEQSYIFVLCSPDQKACPVYEPIMVMSNKQEAKVGEELIFTVGSYRTSAYAYVKIVSNAKVLIEEWVMLNKEMRSYTIKVEEENRGKLLCSVLSICEGKLYEATETVTVPFTNKMIDFEYVTFRNQLLPGEKVSWRIKLMDEHKQPMNAELLCTMYDASLDVFAKNQFMIDFGNTSPNLLDGRYSQARISQWKNKYQRALNSQYYTTDYPQWRYSMFRREIICFFAEESEMDAGVAQYERGTVLKNSIATGSSDAPKQQVRSNFAETAFFYPFLKTDETGTAVIEFEMPESLTKWKMQGIAHTQDCKSGVFEKFVQTRKVLMIVPNSPRFLYERDVMEWSAKVVNSGAVPISGNVHLEFFDAETGNPIPSMLSESNQSFEVPASSTQGVKFQVTVPTGVRAITYRMVADGKQKSDEPTISFSDGEEKSIPVLSKQVLLTESLPLYITKKGIKTYDFEKFNWMNVNMQSCVFEFTPNPKWYALLSLPYLMTFPYECNEQTFNRLYANMMASYIVRSNPNFEKMLHQAMDSFPELLCSKLSQDEELKQNLLAEMPWVQDAQSEEESIQQLYTLFDTKRMDKEIAAAIDKLERGQNKDGSWAWFLGGRSNTYITQYILLQAGRLREAGVAGAFRRFISKSALHHAIQFVDAEIRKNYENLRKNKDNSLKTNLLSPYIIQYLYARSYYLEEIPPQGQAYDFYAQQLLQYGNQVKGIYLQAITAMTLNRMGQFELRKHAQSEEPHLVLARQIMEKIKERAIYSDEMGMYWKKDGHGYYWYESLIERQTLLIDAFATILQDVSSVEQMKVWLLQQKRTQNWSTTRSTADACSALLINQFPSKEAVPSQVTVSLCEDTLHFTDEWQFPIKRDMDSCLSQSATNSRIELSRTDDNLSYGALFFRYFQDMDSIEATNDDLPLSIRRTVYKVDINERGEVLVPIESKGGLRVGDKIRVKLIIKCDRDMEFVHLKDVHAAAFEPTEALSGYRYQGGLGYYEAFKDASVNFFFDYLPKGDYVFEHTYLVNQSGTFNSGFSTIQCMYAPEFTAHSASKMIQIK